MQSSDVFNADQARQVAEQLADEWQLKKVLRPYLKHRWQQREDVPTLHLEDITGIPFVDGISGVREYQHRARVRAADGDIFAAGTHPPEGYEEYNRDILQIGQPAFVHAAGDNPMAVARACCDDSGVIDQLTAIAADAGGLALHPYMAIDSVWNLARTIQDASGVDVDVIGPPPPVLWVANDKSHLSRLVEECLDASWLVDTFRSRDPQELATALGELAKRCPQVGLKRTRCASAMGNAVYAADDLRGADEEELLAKVHEFLTETRWHHDEDILAVQWCDTDLSPSTQLWVPPRGDGPPVVEGVYEQLLDGPEKIFLGSRPSTLPDRVNDTIAQASLQVCTALQHMGYAGRCSFDFIITGDPRGEFRARFTECNGRWGGTSTPMHLVDRITPADSPRPDYVATDYYLSEAQMGMTFSDLRSALDDDLYSPQNRSGRFVLYNVGPLRSCGKFDVISIGESPEDARRGIDDILPRKLSASTDTPTPDLNDKT